MMKKTLLSIGLATALAIPMGSAVAAGQEIGDPTPTTVLAEQDRDQVRDCDLYDDGVVTPVEVGDRDQNRDCDLCDGEAAQIQDRDRDRLHDPALGDESPVQNRVRAQERVEVDGDAGPKAPGFSNGFGDGDGDGPVRQGPRRRNGSVVPTWQELKKESGDRGLANVPDPDRIPTMNLMTTSEAPKVVVADDEENIRTLVGSYLRSEGYDVITVEDGAAAVDLVRRSEPDLVVLDVLMPGIDGIEALRQIRTFSDVYVIMLTARAEETDKLIGLSVGADDYLTKPFSPRELVARVKAVLRRSRPHRRSFDEVQEFAGLRIDMARREVAVDGELVSTTALELDLLAALASQPGRVFSRSQLLESVWGWDYIGDDRVVDVHIRNLRRALSDDAADPRFIGTVRNVGYRFIPEST